MFHAISLGLVLFGTWLLFSGIYVPLLLFFGVASCALIVWIAHRMDVVDHEGHPIHLAWRFIGYWVWLSIEIIKSNIDVAKRILDPKMPIDPVVIEVEAKQPSELGQVIYANSITLTPGTVSIRIANDSILVHALSSSLAADIQTGEMGRRVTAIDTTKPHLEAPERQDDTQ